MSDNFTSGEKCILGYIRDYYSEGPDLFAEFMDVVSKPLEFLSRLLPDRANLAVARKVQEYVLHPLAGIAANTFADSMVFSDFPSRPGSMDELRQSCIQEMWQAADAQFAFNAVATTLQGAGTGLGGLSMLAVVLQPPRLTLVSFRSSLKP